MKNFLALGISLLFQTAFVLTSVGQELEMPIENGILKGTLSSPDGAKKLVIIHAGSGPTDRNGNQPTMQNNSLKLLAEGLAEQGIATFRMDKRGIAQSKVEQFKEEDLSFDTFVHDLSKWIDKLAATKDYSSIWLVGHSEGVLVSTLAAQQVKGVDGFIGIAGTGRPADVLLKAQLEKQPEFVSKPALPIIDSLKAGHHVKEVPSMLNVLFRPSVQPYLISWFKYDPAQELGKLNMPILLIQGTTDLQVSLEDANLLKAANANNFLLPIENMNHVLKEIETADAQEQSVTYTNPNLPLHPALVSAISDFIKTH